MSGVNKVPDGWDPEAWYLALHAFDNLPSSPTSCNPKCEKITYKKLEVTSATPKKCHIKGLYVYAFLDSNNNVLYIGKTDRLKHRVGEHLRGHSNLDTSFLNELDKMYYIEFDNACDQEIYEIYLINYYQPKYNKISKTGVGHICLDIPTDWYVLEMESKYLRKESDMDG